MAEYIEREALIHRMRSENGRNPFADLEDGINFVKTSPAADVVKVRHGVWILSNTNPYGDPNIFNRTQKICSCCGWMNACRYAYCPNCGAKMDGKGESE